MKWIIVLILILSGCKEQEMASSGKSYPMELVSTNITDNTDVYDSTAYYGIEAVVQDGGFIYEKITQREYPYPWRDGVKKDDVFYIDGNFYKATFDIPMAVDSRFGFDIAVPAPTWAELMTTDSPVLVGDYTFETTIKGTSPHTALWTTVKSGATLIFEGVLSSVVIGKNAPEVRGVVAAMDSGYIAIGCLGCAVVFENGTMYGSTDGEVGATASLVGIVLATIEDRGFAKISIIAPSRPFDTNNTTVATMTGDMTMKGKSTHRFNAFTLANVIGESFTYTVKDETGVTINTDTVTLDCWLDDDYLYDQKGVTVLVKTSQTIPKDGTVEVTITNSANDTQAGTFETNTVVDDGVTGLDVEITTKNHHDHTPNAWGEIELGNKPVLTRLTYTVRGLAGETLNKAHRRHKVLEESFATLDVTDIVKKENTYSIKEAVKRGIMTVTSTKLVIQNGKPNGWAEYRVSFQEIV